MNVVNETDFTFAPLMGKVVFPKDTITLIVKGTFALRPDAAAEAVPPDEQLPPTGDLYYEDDPLTTVRYESDFAPFKPRADVILVGHCHAPGGEAVAAIPVKLRIGTLDKSLMVLGDRTRRRTRMGAKATEGPRPFTCMALRYENSFGGPDYPRNPAGKGIGPYQGQEKVLPNLKVLKGDPPSPLREGLPAGFGPLGRTWAQRMALVGRYGQKWKKERWPWLPEDFDWGYFNAAPADQQVNGYLKGDESFYFKHLHPCLSEYAGVLPGMRVRCFLSERMEGRPRFREIQMPLDTLWLDMDAEKMVLVWRGLATVNSPSCEQIEDLLIVRESLSEAPCAEAYYLQMLQERKAAMSAAPTEEPAAPEAELPPEAPSSDRQIAAMEGMLQQVMDQFHRRLDVSGLNSDLIAAIKAQQDPSQAAETLLQGLDLPPVDMAAARTNAAHQLRTIIKEGGEDAAVVDELEELLREMNAAKPAGQAAATPPPTPENLTVLMQAGQGVMDQDLSGADFSRIHLEKADFREARLEGALFCNARLAGADFSGADLAGADFQGADLTGARFGQTDLSGANFQSAALVRADFTEAVLLQADLRGADLKRALLVRAQLGQADLSGTNLQECDLREADLSGAHLARAVLKEARLSMAVFSGADLTQADLDKVIAGRTGFEGCVLTEARFRNAGLQECNFSDCRCDRADFQNARLNQATLEGAVGREANFRRADLEGVRAGERVRLPGAVFRRATGAKANWSGADLSGADFILAVMPACDFSGANLSRCDGRTADMKQAVFDQAVLTKAKFNRANLFQVRLEAADLTGANFKGSNLYGSEFLNAVIDPKTSFKQANLKGTKLASLQGK